MVMFGILLCHEHVRRSGDFEKLLWGCAVFMLNHVPLLLPPSEQSSLRLSFRFHFHAMGAWDLPFYDPLPLGSCFMLFAEHAGP